MKKIKLTQKQFALIDDDDYKKVSIYKWHASPNRAGFYAQSGKILMHRLIMETPKGSVVDHINCNSLDNRKANLRNCLNRQNLWGQKLSKNNKSGFKGVTYNKDHGKYQARININRKRICLGSFILPEDASIVYQLAAKKYFGAFHKK